MVPGGPLGGGGRTPLLLLFFRGGGGGGGGFLGALDLVGAVTEGVGRTMVVVDVMEVCKYYIWYTFCVVCLFVYLVCCRVVV